MRWRKNLKFKEFLQKEEPALEVFNKCHEIVFEGGDGNTEYLDRIAPEARLVYLTWCFDGEIHNGGFRQLFFNSLGDHCLEILEGLRKLKARKSIELLEKALVWFPESRPSIDRGERWKQLEPYKDDNKYELALEELDMEFYKYEDNLAGLLQNFVRNNEEAEINT